MNGVNQNDPVLTHARVQLLAAKVYHTALMTYHSVVLQRATQIPAPGAKTHIQQMME